MNDINRCDYCGERFTPEHPMDDSCAKPERSTMIANGRLQHHFWGTYHATIALVFACSTDADLARQKVFPMFTKQHADSRILHGTFKNPELRHVESLLKQHGADMNKVRSLRFSIDYGEPFTVDVHLSDGSTQIALEYLCRNR